MARIKVHDKFFETYLPEEIIQQKIKELAAAISKDVNAEICFIKLASYKGTRSTGHVITAIGLDHDLYNRHVVIIEDIVDTGKTLHTFLPQLHHQHPASLKIITLLHKPEATEFSLALDYIGFTIPNKFVVGYGLDYDGLGRNLKEIYQLVDTP
jgi:hypoxanthine phosphoribosyltransferase